MNTKLWLKKGVDVHYAVVRASMHREREKPPAALWLAWLAPYDPSWDRHHRRNHLARIRQPLAD